MQKVAIIGSGMAGMAAAHKLYPHADITLFEKEGYVGGHANTVSVEENERSIPIDTGFMVFNKKTYPLMVKLFEDLKVDIMPTDMSFGVQHINDKVEYMGSNLNGIFAQRINLFRPSFWKMIRDIVRFNKDAHTFLDKTSSESQGIGLREFVAQHGYGRRFLHHYLLPMTSAIWSTPPDQMLNFPAASLLRFMDNHGLLGVNTQFQWYTVRGGSRQYRDKLIAPFNNNVRIHYPVETVIKTERGADVIDCAGKRYHFDKVIIATHADQALKLRNQPTKLEQQLLEPFKYADNDVILHSDATIMPRNKNAWAAWNYRMETSPDGHIQASTHYWMNALQKVSDRENYFVSVNPPKTLNPDLVLRKFSYSHPMFDSRTADAQKQLPELNRDGSIYYCGSYFRYGFHEDALMSGFACATSVLESTQINEQLPLPV
jgi:predicted NAD/FAD-binding protein